VNRIYELKSPFNAVAYANCDPNNCNAPAPQPGNSLASSTYANDIKAAFDIAPVFFQYQLCALPHIYIVPHQLSIHNPFMWGMRKYYDPTMKHIAISVDAWSPSFPIMQSRPLASYESSLVSELLLPASTSATGWINGVYYTASPDPPAPPQNPRAIALLDILAHEMGHIIWWEKDVLHATCNIKGVQPNFYLNSWATYQSTPRFRGFGARDPGNVHIGPDVRMVSQDLKSPPYPPGSSNFPNASDDIYNIYNGQSASLLATVAPDEDFVETYKLWVLTSTDASNPSRLPLTTLTVTIPQKPTVDLLNILTNPSIASTLFAKKEWIRSCLAWP
jgi:hypothetical protein